MLFIGFTFLVGVLPRVTGSLLTFFGDCIRRGDSWKQCKAQALSEYITFVVRLKLVRE
jgi:hypothetical protein